MIRNLSGPSSSSPPRQFLERLFEAEYTAFGARHGVALLDPQLLVWAASRRAHRMRLWWGEAERHLSVRLLEAALLDPTLDNSSRTSAHTQLEMLRRVEQLGQIVELGALEHHLRAWLRRQSDSNAGIGHELPSDLGGVAYDKSSEPRALRHEPGWAFERPVLHSASFPPHVRKMFRRYDMLRVRTITSTG